MRLCVRARCVRTYVIPVLPMRTHVRTYERACARMSPPWSHARTRVCTHVRACIVCVRTQPRGRGGALSTRASARTCAYVRTYVRTRVPPYVALCLTPCVHVRTYARNSFGLQRFPKREGG